METVLKTLVENEGRHLRELAEFVAIPSVSTDPAHAADVRRAADWVAERLRKAGPIEVETWETPRHPAVFGRWNGAPCAPQRSPRDSIVAFALYQPNQNALKLALSFGML